MWCAVTGARHTENSGDGCTSWGGYTFNTTLFPDPAAFIESLHTNGAYEAPVDVVSGCVMDADAGADVDADAHTDADADADTDVDADADAVVLRDEQARSSATR